MRPPPDDGQRVAAPRRSIVSEVSSDNTLGHPGGQQEPAALRSDVQQHLLGAVQNNGSIAVQITGDKEGRLFAQ